MTCPGTPPGGRVGDPGDGHGTRQQPAAARGRPDAIHPDDLQRRGASAVDRGDPGPILDSHRGSEGRGRSAGRRDHGRTAPVESPEHPSGDRRGDRDSRPAGNTAAAAPASPGKGGRVDPDWASDQSRAVTGRSARAPNPRRPQASPGAPAAAAAPCGPRGDQGFGSQHAASPARGLHAARRLDPRPPAPPERRAGGGTDAIGSGPRVRDRQIIRMGGRYGARPGGM